ncbi:WhiB family transcriptional regulator [Micromonospora sp. L32]|uniref:WhiB family transcriptional regulator n=1 Tax=Micromonospora sp. L32 TaxID=3452214 RepID=UPI003F8A86FA
MSITVLRPATTNADHDWRLRGNCLDVDPDVMHPDDRNHFGEQEAKKICAGCPVATQCLKESFDLRDWHGIRAGLTGNERRNLDPTNPPKRCKRCNAQFVPRLDTQVRCRTCARLADGNRAKGAKR